jgi:antitoxin component YwqK of YwqJK toxin-antitoxin module
MFAKRLLLLFLLLAVDGSAGSNERLVIDLDDYYAIVRGEKFAVEDNSESPYTGLVIGEGVVMGYKLRFELEVVNGWPHGREIGLDAQGQKINERHWLDGVLDGLETWWEKGKKNKQINYERGLRQGEETWWYENGNLRCVIEWDNNIQDGTETCWHRNGQKSYEVNWKNGKRTGQKTSWYKNGQVESQSTYVDDLLQGKYTYWHENGVKSIEGNMIDGRKNGLLIKWSPKGRLVFRRCYDHNELLNPPAVDLWPEDQHCPPAQE